MVGFFDTDLGRVQISPSIVRKIIMREVEKNRFFRFPGTKLSESASRKVIERCVKVNFTNGGVEAILMLAVLYGAKIIKEARELQGRIIKAIELTAGLKVSRISINVESVYSDDDKQPLLLDHETLQANVVNQ